MERTYHCAKIAKGTAEAEALVSKDAVCFYLVVPETGELIERNHDINGKNVAGKILIMPSGKGSSVVQADGLYKLLMKGKHGRINRGDSRHGAGDGGGSNGNSDGP